MQVYHYSNTKFDSVDFDKCDGFWMTTIQPAQKELLEEIGAQGLKFCAVIELNDNGDSVLNAQNYDVESVLSENEASYIENIYDGFTDFAVASETNITIIEWIEL